MGKQQTRKQQQQQQQQEGGRRHKGTRRHKGSRRRGTRKLSPWNKFVKKIYHQMKGQNKKTTFGQALKEASKRKKEM